MDAVEIRLRWPSAPRGVSPETAERRFAVLERETVKGEGICPRCGGLGTYVYDIQGPLKLESGGSGVKILYSFNCITCGLKESKKIITTLEGFYPLRYILDPRVRVVLERIRLLSIMKEE